MNVSSKHPSDDNTTSSKITADLIPGVAGACAKIKMSKHVGRVPRILTYRRPRHSLNRRYQKCYILPPAYVARVIFVCSLVFVSYTGNRLRAVVIFSDSKCLGEYPSSQEPQKQGWYTPPCRIYTNINIYTRACVIVYTRKGLSTFINSCNTRFVVFSIIDVNEGDTVRVYTWYDTSIPGMF